MMTANLSLRSAVPPQMRYGLLLIAIFWPLNWMLSGVRTSYLFFFLWLGYILTVDGIIFARTGTSMWFRSPRAFALQFFASAPAWWLFEVINWRTRNWEYLGREHFSGIEYFILATFSFSTVMPAVFETAELVRTMGWLERFAAGPRFQSGGRTPVIMMVIGLGMLALTLAQPKYFYPLVWGSVFFILEPINIWLGRATVLTPLSRGDWRPVVALGSGALLCGFFWEMWNYYSYPKWIYHTPGAEFCYVFEMPLLGFLGYIPFAWELHALRSFLWPQAPALRL
jgi:hypothetical protein